MYLLKMIEHWLDHVLDDLFREGWSTVHGLHTADGCVQAGRSA